MSANRSSNRELIPETTPRKNGKSITLVAIHFLKRWHPHWDLTRLDLYTYHGKGVTAALRTSGECSALRLGKLLEQLTTSPGGCREELRGHFQKRDREGTAQSDGVCVLLR